MKAREDQANMLAHGHALGQGTSAEGSFYPSRQIETVALQQTKTGPSRMEAPVFW